MIPWFWIVIVVVTSVAYLLLFRQFTIDHNWAWFIPILFLGVISFYAYYKVFSAGDIGATYGIMTGSIVVLVAIGSAFFFSEQFIPMKILALALIILGVVLLAMAPSQALTSS